MPRDIAVLGLFEYHDEQDEFLLNVLRRLAPALTGILRAVVEDTIASGKENINETMFQCGPGGVA